MRNMRVIHGAQKLRRWFHPLPRWKKVVTITMLVLMICTPIAASFVTIHALRNAPPSSNGAPNHLDPNLGSSTTIHLPAPSNLPAFTPAKTQQPINRPNNGPHPSFTIQLAPDHPATGTSKDGRLTVAVPAGAITPADLAATGNGAQQAISLQVTETALPSGSSSGGGLVSLGTYTVQLVDASGKPLSHGLRTSATLTLSYGAAETVFDLAHAFIVLNGATSTGSTPVTLDRNKRTLTAQLPADSSLQPPHKAGYARLQPAPWITSISWDTFSLMAAPGSPDPRNTGLNAGGYSTSMPIDLPSGPGGTAPQLTLQYNSATVSEQHSPQAPAGWMGEGWNLGMASISWSEHNIWVDPNTALWENQWMLTDPSGASTELIPPSLSESTFLDDTGNIFTTTPVQWHTARENYSAIYSLPGPVTLNTSLVNPPCFRVLLSDGGMEEYGCTADSLQYADQNHPVKWLLDMYVDSYGNQVHYTYQRDMEPVASGQYLYPRDSVLHTISWDSPSCMSTTTMCTGANWKPLLQVAFIASHTVKNQTNTSGNCNTTTNARCDDPLDLSGQGGLPVPQILSTFVLNSMDVETAATINGSPGWSILTHYQFSYAQNGPISVGDPVTGRVMSTAGSLELTQIQKFGQDFKTALPPITMTYGVYTQYYEDSTFSSQSLTNCGPAWNTGCNLWSQSYQGNSLYLSTFNNGDGAVESLTWANARNNTHGSAQPADPLYCDTHQDGYPCNLADDQAWSRIVLQEDDATVNRITQNGQGGAQTTTPITQKKIYTYQLSYPLAAQECADCVAGMYWGDQTDGDFLDFYNSKFMGFSKVSISRSDGSLETHSFYGTEGIGVYDTSKVVTCHGGLSSTTTPCHASPWSDLVNAGHGLETGASYYDTNGSLLKQTFTDYQAVCPPAGVSPSPQYTDPNYASTYGPWNGELVSELDRGNPVAVCDVQPTDFINETINGSLPHYTAETDSYSYDSFGRVTQVTQTNNGGNGSGSPKQVVTQFTYVWTHVANTAFAPYLLTPIAQIAIQDGSGNRVSCEQRQYDNNPYVTGDQTQGTPPVAGSLTAVAQYTTCGTSPGYVPDGRLVTTYAYDQHGNLIGDRTPNYNAGQPGAPALWCVGSDKVIYNHCYWYDAFYGFLSTGMTKGGFLSGIQYSFGQGNGLWPMNYTDANGQETSVNYDLLGRPTSVVEPGDTGTAPTQSYTYTNWCTTSGAQTPCVEQDVTQRITATSTVTTRNFYDGLGNLIETRSPGPAGSRSDVVQYFSYDNMGRQVGQSVRYFVTSYTGAPGSAAFSIPDSTQLGTTMAYDGLGRVIKTTDAMSHTTTTSYLIMCGVPGAPYDTGCYASTRMIDANQHQTVILIDGLGRTSYAISYTGTTSTGFANYATIMYAYDAAGRLRQTVDPLGNISRATYDTSGRETQLQDPDLGTLTYNYDADGNIISEVDPRGAAGTIYMAYDSTDRRVWASTTSNGTNPLATWTYDGGPPHTNGLGRLLGENFYSNGVSGSYIYNYDARGQLTGWQMQIGPNSGPMQTYPFTFGYNDAGQQTSVTGPDSATDTANLYDANDWLNSVTSPRGQSTLTYVSGLQYLGLAGAAGLPTSAQLGNGLYTESLSYDNLLNPTETAVVRNSDQSVLYDQTRTFDAVGNTQTVDTMLPGGKTDNQQFCYDALNRLTWAGSSGSAPCGTLTPGTLNQAYYTSGYSYDQNNRLTSGPLGSYQYSDPNHENAVTTIGAGSTSYNAQYDVAGDMTCRQASSLFGCTSNSGQTMTYDPLRRLNSWQNQPNNPTQTAQYSYDGEGRRVQQSLTSSSGTAVTQYIGPFEEITTAGGTTSATRYGNAVVATAVVDANGALSYQLMDNLGTASVTLSGSTGNLTGEQLFTPYGSLRYGGNMPGSIGFTGHLDDPSGLIYMNARYYDPVAGQFTSADTVQGPNRYGYVQGNPTTYTDPTGHDEGGDCGDCYASSGPTGSVVPSYTENSPSGSPEGSPGVPSIGGSPQGGPPGQQGGPGGPSGPVTPGNDPPGALAGGYDPGPDDSGPNNPNLGPGNPGSGPGNPNPAPGSPNRGQGSPNAGQAPCTESGGCTGYGYGGGYNLVADRIEHYKGHTIRIKIDAQGNGRGVIIPPGWTFDHWTENGGAVLFDSQGHYSVVPPSEIIDVKASPPPSQEPSWWDRNGNTVTIGAILALFAALLRLIFK